MMDGGLPGSGMYTRPLEKCSAVKALPVNIQVGNEPGRCRGSTMPRKVAVKRLYIAVLVLFAALVDQAPAAVVAQVLGLHGEKLAAGFDAANELGTTGSDRNESWHRCHPGDSSAVDPLIPQNLRTTAS